MTLHMTLHSLLLNVDRVTSSDRLELASANALIHELSLRA
jgi:hypothetical protein